VIAGKGSADNDDVERIADGAVGDAVVKEGDLEMETGEGVLEGEKNKLVD